VCEADGGSRPADTESHPDVVDAVVAFLDDLLDEDDDLDVVEQPPP
jgi:hypothetical protein